MAGALEANKTPRERQEARASHMGFWGLSRRGPLLAAHEKRGNDLPQIRGAVQLGGVDGALHEPAGGKQWVEHALGPGAALVALVGEHALGLVGVDDAAAGPVGNGGRRATHGVRNVGGEVVLKQKVPSRNRTSR